MFDELLELFNPFNSGNQKSHEVDSVVDEMAMARVNEISQLVRSTLYADATPAAPTIDFGRPTFGHIDMTDMASTGINFDNPVGMEAAVPTKLKQELQSGTPQPTLTTATPEQVMASQSRAALDSIYAEMPTTKPVIPGDEFTFAN